MSRGISLQEADKRCAEESLRFFIDGGKYARDGKPKSIRWLIGVINSSSLNANELKMIVNNARHNSKTVEEKNRFDEAESGIGKIIKNRMV